VNTRVRRRRAFLLLSLALACGGLAASRVRERERVVERRVGTPVPVVVAARDLPADRPLRRGDLALREVPARFAPRDALGAVAEVAGLRPAVPLATGSYLTAGQLQAGGRRAAGGGLRSGERALEVAVSGAGAMADAATPGARVDVLVSTEPRSGPGRSFLALEDVELLALRSGSSGAGGGEQDGAAARAGAVATLRVGLRQAIYLTAAQNFAREVRLLPRPPGDRRRLGRAGVGAGSL
jgi:pilus assembly protein CpaB